MGADEALRAQRPTGPAQIVTVLPMLGLCVFALGLFVSRIVELSQPSRHPLPWSFVQPLSQLWDVLPSLLVVELISLLTTLLALSHAATSVFQPVLLLVATMHSLICTALSPTIRWPAQAMLMLSPSLPLHELCLSIATFYISATAASRLHLTPMATAAAAGLLAMALHLLHGLVGLRLLWWSWHDLHPALASQALGVPLAPTMWSLLSTSTLVYVLRWACSRFAPLSHASDDELLASLHSAIQGLPRGPFVVVVPILALAIAAFLGFIIQLVVLECPGSPGPRSVAVAILSGSAIALASPRSPRSGTEGTDSHDAEDFKLFSGVSLYVGAMVALRLCSDPALHASTGAHQPLCSQGACLAPNSTRDSASFALWWGPTERMGSFGAKGTSTPYSASCAKWPGGIQPSSQGLPSQWYTICGAAEQPATAISGTLAVLSLGIFSTVLFGVCFGPLRPLWNQLRLKAAPQLAPIIAVANRMRCSEDPTALAAWGYCVVMGLSATQWASATGLWSSTASLQLCWRLISDVGSHGILWTALECVATLLVLLGAFLWLEHQSAGGRQSLALKLLKFRPILWPLLSLTGVAGTIAVFVYHYIPVEAMLCIGVAAVGGIGFVWELHSHLLRVGAERYLPGPLRGVLAETPLMLVLRKVYYGGIDAGLGLASALTASVAVRVQPHEMMAVVATLPPPGQALLSQPLVASLPREIRDVFYGREQAALAAAQQASELPRVNGVPALPAPPRSTRDPEGEEQRRAAQSQAIQNRTQGVLETANATGGAAVSTATGGIVWQRADAKAVVKAILLLRLKNFLKIGAKVVAGTGAVATTFYGIALLMPRLRRGLTPADVMTVITLLIAFFSGVKFKLLSKGGLSIKAGSAVVQGSS